MRLVSAMNLLLEIEIKYINYKSIIIITIVDIIEENNHSSKVMITFVFVFSSPGYKIMV